MQIVVLGATGLVGRTMLQLLVDRDYVSGDPLLLTSARSAGKKLEFRGRELICREVHAEAFAGVDIALFSAGGDPSRTWGPRAAEVGAWVIDNSSAFRMDPGVPLVVPEINGDLIPASACSGGTGGIIANPNCSTIQVAMALAPLDGLFGIREVQVATYQAVSGAGQSALDELQRQVREQVSGGPAEPSAAASAHFPRAMAGNVIPAIGSQLPDGSYEEEAKVERELRKILGRDADLAVTCTAVRVPVASGHSAAVRIVCEQPVDCQAAVRSLAASPGLEVAGEPHQYLTPREIAGRNEVHVGRVRRDPNDERALLLWIVADNLLKGAAWNAIQIADRLAAGAPK